MLSSWRGSSSCISSYHCLSSAPPILAPTESPRGPLISFWFSKSGIGTEKLLFKWVSWWCCRCWSGEYTSKGHCPSTTEWQSPGQVSAEILLTPRGHRAGLRGLCRDWPGELLWAILGWWKHTLCLTSIFKKLVVFIGDENSLSSSFFLSLILSCYLRLFICELWLFIPCKGWWFRAVQKMVALGFVMLGMILYFPNMLSCLFPELCVFMWGQGEGDRFVLFSGFFIMWLQYIFTLKTAFVEGRCFSMLSWSWVVTI